MRTRRELLLSWNYLAFYLVLVMIDATCVVLIYGLRFVGEWGLGPVRFLRSGLG
jgi:hypothetical protein